MKVLSSLIMILAVFTVQNANATQTHTEPSVEAVTAETIAIYPAVATTDNGFGQDYSIGIEIHGSKSSFSNSIHKVMCEGRSVSYRSVFGADNKYSFSYGNYTYYFYFW